MKNTNNLRVNLVVKSFHSGLDAFDHVVLWTIQQTIRIQILLRFRELLSERSQNRIWERLLNGNSELLQGKLFEFRNLSIQRLALSIRCGSGTQY